MTHQHQFREPNCIEIDEHVCLSPTVHGGASHVRNADGTMAGGEVEHLAGFIFAHDLVVPNPDFPWRCEGAISVDPHQPPPIWTVTGSLEGGDLTLSPSILDTVCGFHGYVQNGKWVPA